MFQRQNLMCLKISIFEDKFEFVQHFRTLIVKFLLWNCFILFFNMVSLPFMKKGEHQEILKDVMIYFTRIQYLIVVEVLRYFKKITVSHICLCFVDQ